jgi:hypothetical protein
MSLSHEDDENIITRDDAKLSHFETCGSRHKCKASTRRLKLLEGYPSATNHERRLARSDEVVPLYVWQSANTTASLEHEVTAFLDCTDLGSETWLACAPSYLAEFHGLAAAVKTLMNAHNYALHPCQHLAQRYLSTYGQAVAHLRRSLSTRAGLCSDETFFAAWLLHHVEFVTGSKAWPTRPDYGSVVSHQQGAQALLLARPATHMTDLSRTLLVTHAMWSL